MTSTTLADFRDEDFLPIERRAVREEGNRKCNWMRKRFCPTIMFREEREARQQLAEQLRALQARLDAIKREPSAKRLRAVNSDLGAPVRSRACTRRPGERSAGLA